MIDHFVPTCTVITAYIKSNVKWATSDGSFAVYDFNMNAAMQ